MGYLAGQFPIVVGSARLHQMAFNWIRPASMVQELADAARYIPEISSSSEGGKHGFTESDLEY
jgi:hypothetical protein